MSAKKVIWLLLGAAVGAGAGYAIATVIVDHMDDYEEEEFIFEGEDPKDEVVTVPPDRTKIKEKKERKDYTKLYKGGDERPELAQLVKQYKEGTVLVADNEELGSLADLENLDDDVDEVDRTKPYLIDREQFETELLQEHQKVYYHWYEPEEVEKGILTDAETENIVTANPDKFLGPEALVSFGLDEADPDFVHVRNEILKVDYEIQWIHEPYKKKKKKGGVKPPVDTEEVDE